MPGCSTHNDCAEKALSRALRGLGAFIGSNPWPFLLLPLALTSALSSGLVFMNIGEGSDVEKQFTPIGSPAKAAREFVRANFPTDDSRSFSSHRLITESTFAALIAVAVKEGDSVLTAKAFAEMLALDEAVRRLRTDRFIYEELCARPYPGKNCSNANPLLVGVRGDPSQIESVLKNFTFPLHEGREFLGDYVGGQTLAPGHQFARPLRTAKAMHLIYYLQEDDPRKHRGSTIWLNSFLERVPDLLRSLNLDTIQVAYTTSQSRSQEFMKVAEDVAPLAAATFILTIAFTILSCARLDCVRTKVWVALCGILTSVLSVISCFGLLLLCGVPFIVTAGSTPFLTLGVGVDDMFIMVSCWQQTQVRKSVRDRMADTYAEAAVSVTITSLSDILAFYIGIGSSFLSIQSFCIYTGTAFVFCFFYNLTFLGAVLALNGRREESNRHWLTFQKVKDKPDESQGYFYNTCCVGGFIDETTGMEVEHPMNRFFRDVYAPFLMRNRTRLAVLLIYLLYISTSIYGCFVLKEGIDVRNLARDTSYIIRYYDWQDAYFTVYGPQVMVVVTESLPYWEPAVRATIEDCLAGFENLKYVHKNLTESWLRVYEFFLQASALNINDHKTFMENLGILFTVHPMAEHDLKRTATEILASRFFIQTGYIYSMLDWKYILRDLKEAASKCKIPIIIYEAHFIYNDQFNEIVDNTVQNVLVATLVMLCISLILIPNPLCSLWVTFTVASVFVGVTGFMSLWGVTLDSLSMIFLIICIGFSVDFSAHISYAIVSSPEPNVNDKAVDALYRLGFPILQGAGSTAVGALLIFMAGTYIFKTFLKILFLVVFFGTAHGIIFIPVFLTYCGFCGETPEEHFEKKEHPARMEGTQV